MIFCPAPYHLPSLLTANPNSHLKKRSSTEKKFLRPNVAFGATRAHTSEERLRKGAKAAISIFKLQEDMPDITKDPAYHAFLPKASRMAREFALFPCARGEEGRLWRMASKFESAEPSDEVMAEVRKELKREAVRELQEDARWINGKHSLLLMIIKRTLLTIFKGVGDDEIEDLIQRVDGL
jgi:hypothetical protein